MDVPSLLISSSINSPNFLLFKLGFCLLRMNIPGEEVLPSSVKKNSENRIVLPTLPVINVSPFLGCKKCIFSFTLYSLLFFCLPVSDFSGIFV